jgi:hypothetical protein
MKNQQSTFGIVSFILALLPFTFGVFVLFNGPDIGGFIDGIESEVLRNSIGWTAGILNILSLSVFPIFAVGLGIVGVIQKDKKRGLAIAGLILGGLAMFIQGLVFFVL